MIVAALFGSAAMVGVYSYTRLPNQAAAPGIDGLLWPNPRQLEDFSLIDQRGVTFDLARLKGRWTVMFFGYSHCPDVCPVTLQVLKTMKQKLESQGVTTDNLQTIFVSVDPRRDTQEHLASYLDYFDPAIIGLTGSEEAVTKLTRQLGVLAIKNEPDENGYYLVDHTAGVMLLDPRARFVAVLRPPHQPDDMAERLEAIRSFVSGAS